MECCIIIRKVRSAKLDKSILCRLCKTTYENNNQFIFHKISKLPSFCCKKHDKFTDSMLHTTRMKRPKACNLLRSQICNDIWLCISQFHSEDYVRENISVWRSPYNICFEWILTKYSNSEAALHGYPNHIAELIALSSKPNNIELCNKGAGD